VKKYQLGLYVDMLRPHVGKSCSK